MIRLARPSAARASAINLASVDLPLHEPPAMPRTKRFIRSVRSEHTPRRWLRRRAGYVDRWLGDTPFAGDGGFHFSEHRLVVAWPELHDGASLPYQRRVSRVPGAERFHQFLLGVGDEGEGHLEVG